VALILQSNVDHSPHAETEKTLLALLGGALLLVSPVLAQDSGALLDLLVKKGIITDQESETLRADLSRDFANNSPAGKLDLAATDVTFKLSGDLRMRYEYNAQTPELATGAAALSNETSRQRFRFRYNTDVLLQKGWSAGFGIETGQAIRLREPKLRGRRRRLRPVPRTGLHRLAAEPELDVHPR
jgi:hypothetical protein